MIAFAFHINVEVYLNPMNPRTMRTAVFAVLAACYRLACACDDDSLKLSVDADGTFHTNKFSMPFSSLASREARDAFIAGHSAKPLLTPSQSLPMTLSTVDYVLRVREMVDKAEKPLAERTSSAYPVNVTQENIGGVSTDVFVPRDGITPQNRNRVLISLHGGAMLWGTRYEGHILSIPLANVGRIKVISVNYRLSPEHRFPAANEDVAAVYKELLKIYEPKNIGIYGNSAGGSLAAQCVAWFQTHGLPRPGAVAFISSAASRNLQGDSFHMPTVAQTRDARFQQARDLYVQGTEENDPLIWPVFSSKVMENFPPTAFINATRDQTMSGAVYSHIQLVKAGVDSELYIWDGLEHDFALDIKLPEASEARAILLKFFERHLGTTSGPPTTD